MYINFEQFLMGAKKKVVVYGRGSLLGQLALHKSHGGIRKGGVGVGQILVPGSLVCPSTDPAGLSKFLKLKNESKIPVIYLVIF